MLGMTACIQTLDPMISTVALVKASKTLGFSTATLALPSGISTLTLAATVIPTGGLADRGRRRVLMAALGVAALGDVLAADSADQWTFLIGRAVAGVGLGDGARHDCGGAGELSAAGQQCPVRVAADRSGVPDGGGRRGRPVR